MKKALAIALIAAIGAVIVWRSGWVAGAPVLALAAVGAAIEGHVTR